MYSNYNNTLLLNTFPLENGNSIYIDKSKKIDYPMINPENGNTPNSDKDNWNPEKISFQNKIEVSVFDVASYILNKMGKMSTMKLQKLVYYCQAWSLVWDENPLFKEEIQAWANGPVVKELFDYHKGHFLIENVEIGNPKLLSVVQKETIDSVINYYGDKSAQWLIDLTHQESPWLEARIGLNPSERGNKVIKLDSMANYYSSL